MSGKCKPGETVRGHYAHGGTFDDMPSDEDLTTPEHLLHALSARHEMSAAAEAAAEIAKDALLDLAGAMRQPAFRAGFGAALLSAAVLARAGARGSVAVLASLMIGSAVERLYGMAEDVHGKLAGGAPGKV